MGNARAASPEGGKAWFEAETESLVTAIEAACTAFQEAGLS
ncbi:MAG: hypothetical protein R6V45_00205 [Oceanipulchritudo sp.]